MEVWKEMRARMEDAGCTADAIGRAESLYEAGAVEDLIRCLRSCRCDALEEIHVRQRRLDVLDGLIRDARKHVKENAR
ncbi:MAG: hypothetical protein IKH56_09550 [Oscillospiraceae bacterium]|nr:hypothetical protein [Oscillospiraceae bacterium]